ncbi:MAG: mannitol dehydrogenase family protein, partial [Gammaproteobacteria bacterium]|nr:mannitol dehydrogenase family protein [Gammaproteobacteria bacterium]
EIVDRLKAPLMVIAAENRTRPTAFIENRELFGDLIDNARFVEAYLTALTALHERGARATLEGLASSKGTL